MLNCIIFFQIFLGEHAPKPPPLSKGMASLSCGYVQRIALTHANLHFRKKNLDPLSNFVYSLGIHVQIN